MFRFLHFWHQWKPATVFESYYDDEGCWAVSIVGLECQCGERKLEEKRTASVGASQKAYNWLHYKEYLDEAEGAPENPL